jgi:high-affinity Fe2+/Pb2+ permease
LTRLDRQEAVMTGIGNNTSLLRKFARWTKAGAALGLVIAGVLGIMILAVSNSAQSAQGRSYRAVHSVGATETDTPWSGSQPPVLL